MICDANGCLVQHRLEAAFASRLMLMEWCGDLAKLISLLRTMEEAQCVTVSRNREVVKLLNQAKHLVLENIPWKVCECQGANRNCPTCQGLGWIGLAESLLRARQSAATVSSAPAAA